MSTPVRLAAFAVALVAVFTAAFGIGRAVGPVAEVEPATHGEADDYGESHADAPPAAAEPAAGADAPDPQGAAYTLDLARPAVAAGRGVEVRFALRDARGEAVTAYDVVHEKPLHLVVVGVPGLADYQHVHPTMADDGTWSVDLDLEAGRYRLYADARPSGAEAMVAEADLVVRGERGDDDEVPPPADTVEVDGYDVTLSGDPSAGRAVLTVSRGGEPVTDLQPYLGASGHLVVIRGKDLDYVHAHPEGDATGPVSFGVSYEESGTHRLFFDFRHEGVVRTAAFTLDVDAEGDGHDH